MIVTVVGPALASFLAYRFSFRLMLAVALVSYASAIVVRLWMATAERFAAKKAAEKPTLSGLKVELRAMFLLLFAGGLLTWIWVTDAVGDIAFNLIGQPYPIYLAEVGRQNLEQIGLLNAAWGVATILASLLTGWLTDRLGERPVNVAGFAVEALGLVILLQAGGFPACLVAMFSFGLGVGCLIPAYHSLISKAVPEDRRGLAYGFFGTSLGILSLPFPWVGAQLWERLGPQAPFLITVVACLISMPIAWFKFILPQGEAESAS
jgi:MFS family permease